MLCMSLGPVLDHTSSVKDHGGTQHVNFTVSASGQERTLVVVAQLIPPDLCTD